MKKITLSLAALCAMLSVNTVVNAKAPVAASTVVSVNADWMKSTTQTWAGMKDGKTYWYKLDKNAKLWWSMDGKKWSEVADGMWADKKGRWMKINNKMLVWSDDLGKTWSEVPDWQWTGSDDMEYKFDKSWSLWVKK